VTEVTHVITGHFNRFCYLLIYVLTDLVTVRSFRPNIVGGAIRILCLLIDLLNDPFMTTHRLTK